VAGKERERERERIVGKKGDGRVRGEKRETETTSAASFLLALSAGNKEREERATLPIPLA